MKNKYITPSQKVSCTEETRVSSPHNIPPGKEEISASSVPTFSLKDKKSKTPLLAVVALLLAAAIGVGFFHSPAGNLFQAKQAVENCDFGKAALLLEGIAGPEPDALRAFMSLRMDVSTVINPFGGQYYGTPPANAFKAVQAAYTSAQKHIKIIEAVRDKMPNRVRAYLDKVQSALTDTETRLALLPKTLDLSFLEVHTFAAAAHGGELFTFLEIDEKLVEYTASLDNYLDYFEAATGLALRDSLTISLISYDDQDMAFIMQALHTAKDAAMFLFRLECEMIHAEHLPETGLRPVFFPSENDWMAAINGADAAALQAATQTALRGGVIYRHFIAAALPV